MGGEYSKARVKHVCEDDHAVVEGCVGVGVLCGLLLFLGVVDGGLVAVMTIGDEEDVVFEEVVYLCDEGGVGDFVKGMFESVVSFDLDEWFLEGLFNVFSYVVGVVDVEELYGFEVGLAGFHEVEAVCFGFGEGAFMCSDVLVGGVEFEEGEKTAHGDGCIINCVLDFVGIDGGGVVLCEDVFLLPLGEEVLCACVTVVGSGVGGFLFAEDEADKVVWVLVVELVLHGG